jgi:hypothetical protein
LIGLRLFVGLCISAVPADGFVQARTLHLQGVGVLPSFGTQPVGVVGEAITVSVELRSEDFSYLPVANEIFHYFVPDTTVPVTIVGATTGNFPGIANLNRFLALELDLSSGSSDQLGIDVGAGNGVTGLFGASCKLASCFDGDVTPFTSDELFDVFASVFEHSGDWKIQSNSAVFAGPNDDLLYLGSLDWSLVDPNEPPTQQLSIEPTFDVQLKPGTLVSIEDGAEFLKIDGGFGTSFPVLDVLAEFDLASIPTNAQITSAELSLDTTGGSGSITVEAMGYAGDGLASLSDATATETLIGSKLITSVGGDVTISLDKNYVASLLGQASHLGLRLTSATTGPVVDIAAMEYPLRDPATLIVKYFVPVALAGDYNDDGVVDAADYTVWRDSLGQSQTGLPADGTGPQGVPDGIVDQFDYALWKMHFGESTTDAATAGAVHVPEPVGCVLVMLGILGSAAGRQRARRC